MDAVATKNWLKRVSNILTDIELDNELKLRVATRLLDKSAIVWWDNMKLCSPTPVTWNNFVRKFNKQYYTHFYCDQKQQ